MSKFKDTGITRSVTDFIVGTGLITASLPANNPCCRYCRWSKHDYGLDRELCGLTNEYLMEFKKAIGKDCPINWEMPDLEDIEY